MSITERAILAMDCLTWYLFVHPAGPWPAQCPEYRWDDGADIPTPAQRRDALAELGYQPAPGAEWEWAELFPDPDSPRCGPVALIAGIDVRHMGGEQE
ncbi:DUF6303 family protein [Streptomyces sp. NPDC020917]|uniref:DUF6303 family protein n=1 Tax=Streptomyces sp. NPDC020917 TaxID=3365102 RepID=UPI003792B9E0